MNNVQLILHITKGRRTGKICSLQQRFVISRFHYIYFTITGAKNNIRYESGSWLHRKYQILKLTTVSKRHRAKFLSANLEATH